MRRREPKRGTPRLHDDIRDHLAGIRRLTGGPRIWGLCDEALQRAFIEGGEAAAVRRCLDGPAHLRRLLTGDPAMRC